MKTDLERMWQIYHHLTWLNQIKSKKPCVLMKLRLSWLSQIELLKIKINRSYESYR